MVDVVQWANLALSAGLLGYAMSIERRLSTLNAQMEIVMTKLRLS